MGHQTQPIILTEYPKSGGSWIVSLVGDILGMPMRDIYVKSDFNLFDLGKHPWYKETPVSAIESFENAVIKSHELPGSDLLCFDAAYVHLVRDGRDVIVSKWFYEREFCVQNGILSSFDKDFDTYVEETALAWAEYVENWSHQDALLIRYEDFLSNPTKSLSLLLELLTHQTFSAEKIKTTIEKFSCKNFSATLDDVFNHNSFVRKGATGDWKNYFSERNIQSFKNVANPCLIRFGYESNPDWGL